MADLIIGIIFHEYLNVIDAQNKLPGPMAAALSLLGEINNALNPPAQDPERPGAGGGCYWRWGPLHGASRAGRLDRDLWVGWVPKPRQAGGAVRERPQPPGPSPPSSSTCRGPPLGGAAGLYPRTPASAAMHTHCARACMCVRVCVRAHAWELHHEPDTQLTKTDVVPTPPGILASERERAGVCAGVCPGGARGVCVFIHGCVGVGLRVRVNACGCV